MIKRKKPTLKVQDKELITCDYCKDPVEYRKSITASNGKTICYPCLEITNSKTEYCSFECIATGECDGSC